MRTKAKMLALVASVSLCSLLQASYSIADEGADPSLGEMYDAILQNDQGSYEVIRYRNVGGVAIAQGDIDIGDHKDYQIKSYQNLAKITKALDFKVLALPTTGADALKNAFENYAAQVDAQDSETKKNETSGESGQLKPYSVGIGRYGLWENGLVPYEMDSSIPPNLAAKLKDAIDYWNATKLVSLKPKSDVDPGTIGKTGLLTIKSSSTLQKDPNKFFCSSSIGTGGSRRMFLSNLCEKGNIIHEFGHTLGLWHEHARKDRETLIIPNMDIISVDWKDQYQEQSGEYYETGYDLCSIMHYSQYFDKKKWFTLKPAGVAALKECVSKLEASCRRSPDEANIGQRCGLSVIDRTGVGNMYHPKELIENAGQVQR